jgi:3-deoxy-D-manno-octulosonic-acid transferase
VPETPLAYRALSALAAAALRVANPLSEKLRTGDRERRASVGRWQRWAHDHRDRGRRLLWVHAPSVGEGLQAEAVIALLRQRHPEWQLVYSFFSPSAEALAKRLPVDHADYLPYDTAPNAESMVTALAPDALVFTKLDLWPELATRAARQGARVGMIAATVSPVSGRLNPIARALTRAGYAALDLVGAIDDPDAARMVTLGVDQGRVRVTGDPRFDSAARRAASIRADDPIRRLTAGAPTLVAGSTWEPDEAILSSAFQSVRAAWPAARLIVVPHEPTPERLDRLSRRLARTGLTAARLSTLGEESVPNLVLVDRVGILATVYAGAVLAYVGGGWGTSGLHSVVEPAACGVPVVFGPRWRSSRDAGLLIAVQAGQALADEGQEAASSELAAIWGLFLAQPALAEARGSRGRDLIRHGVGAADRSADVVSELMIGRD